MHMVGQRVYGKFMYLQLICCEPKIALNNKVYLKKKEEEEALFREKVASDAGEAEADCFSLLFSLLYVFCFGCAIMARTVSPQQEPPVKTHPLL